MRARGVALCLSALVSACATQTYDRARAEAPLRSAVEKPLYDLSLMRDEPPPLLAQALEHPFRLVDGADCAALLEEIAALDDILGPDIDREREEDDAFDAAQILTGAVSGVWSLPYRSIVRRLSGAHQREGRLREAILAGLVRRGFLKGAARQAGCSAPSSLGPLD